MNHFLFFARYVFMSLLLLLALTAKGQGSNNRKSHTGDWHSLGITDYNHYIFGGGIGRVNRITFHPVYLDVIYVGTPMGGLWRTIDNGQTWQALTTGILNLGVSGIAIHNIGPEDPDKDILYLLTGDGDFKDIPTSGVIKSTDGGNTWKATGFKFRRPRNEDERFGYKLLMHPTEPLTLFVAMDDGIYKTIDGFESFEKLASSTINEDVYDIEFHPTIPSTMYLSTADKFFKSSDSGNSWERISIPSSWEGDLLPERSAIAVTEANDRCVYVLFGGNSSDTSFPGLYKSTDSGNNFNLRSNAPNIMSLPIDHDGTEYIEKDHCLFETQNGDLGNSLLSLAVSSANEDVVHVGSTVTWKSIDGGIDWKPSSFHEENFPLGADGNYTHVDVHMLVYDDEKLYAGTDGGIYVRDESENPRWDNWDKLSKGLKITQVAKISDNSTIDLILMGTQDNGMNRWPSVNPDSDEIDRTSMDAIFGGDGSSSVIDHQNSDILYFIITPGGIIMRSIDRGVSSEEIIGNIPKDTGWSFNPPLIMHSEASNILYTAGNKIFATFNANTEDSEDVHWEELNNTILSEGNYIGMSYLETGDISGDLYAISGDEVIKCIADDYNVVNDYDCFEIDGPSAASGQIYSNIATSEIRISREGEIEHHVYLTFYGSSDRDKEIKVFLNREGGQGEWENITGNLPNVSVNSIVIDDENNGVYIGTDIGVFYKKIVAEGTSVNWVPFRNKMPTVKVTDLKLTPGQPSRSIPPKLLAATYGLGVWKSNRYGSARTRDITISEENIKGFYFRESRGSMSANDTTVNGGWGTEVEFKSETSIILGLGFEVEAGSSFYGHLGNADGEYYYDND